MGVLLEDVVWYALLAWLYRGYYPSSMLGMVLIAAQIGGALYVWLRLGPFVCARVEPSRPRVIQTRRRRLSVFEKLPEEEINPFINESGKMTQLDRVRVAVNAVTLLPARAVLLVAAVFAAYVSAAVATVGMPSNPRLRSFSDLASYIEARGNALPGAKDERRRAVYAHVAARSKNPDVVLKLDERDLLRHASRRLRHLCWTRPMPQWRRAVLYGVRLACRWILFALGFLWIDSRGSPADPREAPIIVSNHVTFVEPIYMMYAALPCAIGAVENLRMPVVGTIVRALQTITVDRSNPRSRQEVKTAMRARSAAGSGWPHLLIYPEATTTNGRALITFKTGAFNPGRPVQMVRVDYPGRFCPAWVFCGPSLSTIVFRLMCEPYNPLTVDFGPIYKPNPEERRDSLLYARRVRAHMSKQFRVPATTHSYDDVRLQRIANKRHRPLEMAVIGADGIRSHFNMKLDEIKAYFETFEKADTSGDGKLNRSEFFAVLGMPSDAKRTAPEWDHLFELLDEDGDGLIDFRVYLIGMAFANDKLDNAAVLRAVHKIFDRDEDGFLSLDEFTAILHRACPNDEVYTPKSIREIFTRIDTKRTGKVGVEAFIEYASTNSKMRASFNLWKQNFRVTRGSSSDDEKQRQTAQLSVEYGPVDEPSNLEREGENSSSLRKRGGQRIDAKAAAST